MQLTEATVVPINEIVRRNLSSDFLGKIGLFPFIDSST